MSMEDRIELLQGTLDLLILRTLQLGPAHGHAIAKAIQQSSEDVLLVEEGSLYPALHRGDSPRVSSTGLWLSCGARNARGLL